MTSTAPLVLMLPGVPSWGQAGARHRHFNPCWENRERLSCPLPILRLQPLVLSKASPQAGAGMWGRGGQGLAEGPSESAQERGWQHHRSIGLGHRLYSLWVVLQLAFSGLHRAGGLPPFPCGHFLSSQEGHGRGPCQVPLVRMGSVYPERPGCSPGPTKNQGCGLGMHSTQQFLQATGLSDEISALGLDLPSRGGAVGPWTS